MENINYNYRREKDLSIKELELYSQIGWELASCFRSDFSHSEYFYLKRAVTLVNDSDYEKRILKELDKIDSKKFF